QGDYEYAQPVSLPRGATVSMVYTYDNSTNNLRNPNQPPGRVRYGLNSADEMAELWFQVVPRGSNGLKILEQDQLPRVLTNSIAYKRYLLGLDPNNARAHAELGRVLTFLTRYQEALPHLQKALQL